LSSSYVITFYCGICVVNKIIINHHIHQVNCITILVKRGRLMKKESTEIFSYLTCKVTTIYEEERLVNQTDRIKLQTQ